MSAKPPASDPERQARALAELWRQRELRDKSYREQALKILPHVCASCGREFSGKRLRELTVHHRDHNWKNNPPDGSNWELLCLYCHDYEHERHTGFAPAASTEQQRPGPSIFSPFAGLDSLLKKTEPNPGTPAPAGEGEKAPPGPSQG